MNHHQESAAAQKMRKAIKALGEDIFAEALYDSNMTEIILNADGRIWIAEIEGPDGQGLGKMRAVGDMAPENAESFLQIVAESLGGAIDGDNPALDGYLVSGGAKIIGFVPPVTVAPTFYIKKPPQGVMKLSHYEGTEALHSAHYAAILKAVEKNKNIVITGNAGFGKTIFANAILADMENQNKGKRPIIIEDTPELRVQCNNKVTLHTTQSISMQDLLEAGLRMRPDRIIVGDVRGGEALTILRAWSTGYSSGLITIRANDLDAGISRLHSLAREAEPLPEEKINQLIADAVGILVHVKKTSAELQKKGFPAHIISAVGHPKNDSDKGLAVEYVPPRKHPQED